MYAPPTRPRGACSSATDLRLQLLEPDRYPYLFKCLYGLLMLLPQSTAFVALRNRLNAVNSAGFLHIAPKPSVPPPPSPFLPRTHSLTPHSTAASAMSSRSKITRDEIKWGELLSHFRTVQSRHEKARRLALGAFSDTHTAFPSMGAPAPPVDLAIPPSAVVPIVQPDDLSGSKG